MIRHLLATALLLLGATAGSAAPILIDNFNSFKTQVGGTSPFTGWESPIAGVGERSIVGPATNSSVVINETGLPTSDVIGGNRSTTITAASITNAGERLTGRFTFNGSGEKFFTLSQDVSVDGQVQFVYNFPSTNFSGELGLALNFVVLEGGTLNIAVTLADGGASSAMTMLVLPPNPPTPQTVLIPFSSFTGGANLSSLTSITLVVNPSQAQDFGLNSFESVSAVPEPATLATFGLLTLCGGFVARRKLKATAVAQA